MARILPDHEIRALLGTVVLDADEKLLNPNGIELRLGRHVLFHSTGEERELTPGSFLKVNAGESVAIVSMETIDFRSKTVQKVLPGKMLMGLITPTTTMMREGISQVATKIDAGFRGVLNWGLRNGSVKELVLQLGEPIFKLTLFELGENEAPEVAYGDRDNDTYQGSEGITRSRRKIPADIPRSKVVSSGFDRLDPKKQLREAGYPFDHIGTELTNLHGKFELVSSDVRLMKEEFQSRVQDLADKISNETRTLAQKIDETRQNVLEKVETLFDRKFLRVGGAIVGAIPIVYGGVAFLEGQSVEGGTIAFIAVVIGVVILVGTYLLTKTRA